MDIANLPKHVAIILDGNRRWTEKHGLARENSGYYGSAKAMEIVFNWTKQFERDFNVRPFEQLTLYAMSTNNLLRRQTVEIKKGVDAFTACLKEIRYSKIAVKRKIQIKFGGELSMVDSKFVDQATLLEEETIIVNPKYLVNIAVAYDGNKEIEQAAIKLCENKNSLQQHMYFPDASFIDLLIRTGGERRLSGFMLWYIGYAEIRFIETLSGDFSYEEFAHLIDNYCQTQRRFGQ